MKSSEWRAAASFIVVFSVSLSDDGTFLWLMNFAFYAFQIDLRRQNNLQQRTEQGLTAARDEDRGGMLVDKAKG